MYLCVYMARHLNMYKPSTFKRQMDTYMCCRTEYRNISKLPRHSFIPYTLLLLLLLLLYTVYISGPLSILHSPYKNTSIHLYLNRFRYPHIRWLMFDALLPLLRARYAVWAERPPEVMKRSQRWNILQICPRRDSNSGGGALWSNALPIRRQRRPTNIYTPTSVYL